MKTTTVSLKFPTQFSKFIDDQKSIQFKGNRVADLLDHLDIEYGSVKERLLEEDGQVKPYINLFLENKNINVLKGLETEVNDGSCISLLLSRAGG
ncbi:MoaD/ThiS family protein [Aquimarina sp. D1M17]|uniref:MoaD/ThiS family protein n=1 Tax=Aquimarina acroporae TaxID=2937283 RepID=UPI0020C00302|nr:MoaD/ThiS family protein [Aquimarina acroporae]MCK8522363.1 MoaD/ThiS family protein [Aquimarina acroporae]